MDKGKGLTALQRAIIVEFANNNMRINKTAEAVFVSDGAVIYNMKKIRKKTGLDPMRFYELVELLKDVKGEKQHELSGVRLQSLGD